MTTITKYNAANVIPTLKEGDLVMIRSKADLRKYEFKAGMVEIGHKKCIFFSKTKLDQNDYFFFKENPGYGYIHLRFGKARNTKEHQPAAMPIKTMIECFQEENFHFS